MKNAANLHKKLILPNETVDLIHNRFYFDFSISKKNLYFASEIINHGHKKEK